MAQLEVEGDDLVLTLTNAEKLAGLIRDLRVPLSRVRSVELVDDPVRAVRGLRAPGLGLPGRKIGTWRRRDGRTVAVARSGSPAVRVVLDPAGSTALGRQPLQELVINVVDAERVVAAISAAVR